MSTEKQRSLLKEAVAHLRDYGNQFEDDGSNEPLDVAREIEEMLEAPPADRDETPIDVGGEYVPRWVLEYADALTTHYAERGGGSWAIGGVQSREHAPPAAVPAADVEALDFARNAAHLPHGFMLDTNAVGAKEAGVNLARSIKANLAAAAEVPRG